MISEYKLARLSAVLSSILVLSGCSVLNMMNVDAVDDNVDYQKTANSIKALAIPPGLSNPGFDSTYASVSVPSSSNTSQGNVTSSRSAKPAASPRSTLSKTRTSNATSPAPSSRGSGRRVSLGAALLEESGSASTSQKQPANPRPNTQSQSRQSAKPAAAASSGSRNPQVAMMRLDSGEPALAVNAPFSQTWRILPQALSAVGLKVVKQQAEQGIYTTRYQGKPSANLKAGQTYLIVVAENALRQSFIGVGKENGKPESGGVANDVLGRLKAVFER